MIKTFVLFALLLSTGLVFGTDYPVSSAAEIYTAMASAQPGDTLTMRAGTWINQHITFQGNGALGDTILLRAEIPGEVILTGTSTLRISGNYLKVDGLNFVDGYIASGAVIEFRGGAHAHHSRLTNTAIDYYNPTIKTTDYKWISMYGTYNRVDHCYLRGKNHQGTTLVVWLDGNPNYHTIDHNYFAYRPDLGVNGGETIRVGTSDYSMSDSYTLVEYNYFEHCDGEIEIISNKSCENIYRYNTFYECRGTLTLRHGNRCTVEGNFFIGNNIVDTGGIRIIGEDHLVFNNYLQNLRDTGYGAAISLVNGVPDSPLNRYFQVKNARVYFNTIVNCASAISIGTGADAEKSLPPENCIIGNNLVYTPSEIIDLVDEPINLTWIGNIMYGGPLGIPQPPGITMIDPLLSLAEDDLWRPQLNSPAIGAAETIDLTVTDDMDGQQRGESRDTGSDQVSTEPVLRGPLSEENTGPDWLGAIPKPPKVIRVAAGQDSLRIAIEKAANDALIELVTSGGIYSNSVNLLINKKLVIRAASGLAERPLIRQTNPDTENRTLFEIGDFGNLTLVGLELDGMATEATPADYLIRTTETSMNETYRLKVDSCYLHDADTVGSGGFFRAYAGTFADSIIFTNSFFTRCGGEGIRLKDEALNSGNYNVAYFELSNCTIWNTTGAAVDIYAGDDVFLSLGPVIRINHCTFDNCGHGGNPVINANEADFTQLKNCLITNSDFGLSAVNLYGAAASIAYSDTFNTGGVALHRGARILNGMLNADPDYLNATAGDFTLSLNSPVLGMADDGSAMGHVFWSIVSGIEQNPLQALHAPESFDLLHNYPNPFNPATRIVYTLNEPGRVGLRVYNIKGALVATLVDGHQQAGRYAVNWSPVHLASGVYIGVLTSNRSNRHIKMVFIK